MWTLLAVWSFVISAVVFVILVETELVILTLLLASAQHCVSQIQQGTRNLLVALLQNNSVFSVLLRLLHFLLRFFFIGKNFKMTKEIC